MNIPNVLYIHIFKQKTEYNVYIVINYVYRNVLIAAFKTCWNARQDNIQKETPSINIELPSRNNVSSYWEFL